MAVLDSFFPAGLLDTVGGLQRAAYDRTCYVQAPAQTDDAYGGGASTWADVAGPLPCSLNPVPGREALTAGVVEAWSRVLVKLDCFETGGAVGVRPSYRLRTGGTEVAPEGVLHVEAVEDVQGAGRWLHVVAVDAGGA